MPGLVVHVELGDLVASNVTHADLLDARRAVQKRLEGDDLAPVRIAARRFRGRIGVGEVFRDHAHALALREHAGGGDFHRFREIHLPGPSLRLDVGAQRFAEHGDMLAVEICRELVVAGVLVRLHELVLDRHRVAGQIGLGRAFVFFNGRAAGRLRP